MGRDAAIVAIAQQTATRLAAIARDADQLAAFGTALVVDMASAVNWLEVRDSQAADLLKRRLFHISTEAEACVRNASGADKTRRRAELLVFVMATADNIRALADRIEADQQQRQEPPAREDPNELLSPAKLADRLGIPSDDAKTRERIRKRVEEWRKRNLDGGWIEVTDPRPREPRYLYPLGKVWPLVQDLKRSN
jgi:hypothetical protein